MSSPEHDQDASRPRSGILTPSSEDIASRRDGGTQPPLEGRKRGRADSMAMDHLLRSTIALKPHPPNLTVQPRVLQPLMMLPREHLPLACIELMPPFSDLSQSRLFESNIKILDLESRMGAASSILVARNESKGALYALERQENGLYVVCKLGQWVDLDTLAKRATAVSRDRLQPLDRRPSGDATATAPLTTPQTHKAQKKKRAAIEAIQSMVRKRVRSQSDSTFQETLNHNQDVDPRAFDGSQPREDTTSTEHVESGSIGKAYTPLPTPGTQPAEEQAPQQMVTVIFENIRTQYFEALYRSMGSLAYFAKGPLSRARSAFQLDLESNLDMADLVEFLKSLVLTTVQIDKKYRETIPSLLSRMTNLVESSDEGRKKKRRPKKMKLGKDALYPAEDESIRKWWATNKPELKEDETGLSDQQVRSHVSLLRNRETQLQMILILEILALEPLQAGDDAGESNLPALPGAAGSQDKMAPPPPKKRSKHNLPLLVDVHADRLTIWQSTATDEQLLLKDAQVLQPIGGNSQQRSSTEPLRDFCVDVIVPFFSARLPELCDSINRKLGGPVIVSPPKSKALKQSSSKREQKPGAVTKRPVPPKPPRTLQRALSTDQHHRRSVSRGPGNAIALMRSATSTSVPTFKREDSEPVALKTLPRMASDASRKTRVPLSRSSSMSNLQSVKADKKATVEAELRDAISALRKPNREVVGKAMAEAAERKASTIQSAKKVKKVVRSSLDSSIQVEATPANNRFKDVLAPIPAAADIPLVSTEGVVPPSSGGTFVPSTAPRNGLRNAIPGSPSPAVEIVGGTPVKASIGSGFLRRYGGEEPAIPPSSPLVGRRVSGAERLLVPGSAVKASHRRLFTTTAHEEGILQTPVKKALFKVDLKENGDDLHKQPAKEPSIYEKLGWDDDFDDL